MDSRSHKFELIHGGRSDPSDTSTTHEELEAFALRLQEARVAIERHYPPAEFGRLGDTTKFLWNAFAMFETFAHSSGHRSLPDISSEFAAAYALASTDSEPVAAYQMATNRHAEALYELAQAMFDSQSQFMADYPEDDWDDRGLRENVFDGVGQSANILRLIVPKNENETNSDYIARLRQFMQKAIEGVSAGGDQAEQSIALIKQADAVIEAMEELEEMHDSSQDNELFLLKVALSSLVELARQPGHNAVAYAQKKIQQLNKEGKEYRQSESMRIYDALDYLALVYDGLARHDDPEKDKMQRQQFINEHFPSKLFDNPEAEACLRSALNSSYEILKILAGPDSNRHPDLMPPIEKMKSVFLHVGAQIHDPNSSLAGRLRYLAWHGASED